MAQDTLRDFPPLDEHTSVEAANDLLALRDRMMAYARKGRSLTMTPEEIRRADAVMIMAVDVILRRYGK